LIHGHNWSFEITFTAKERDQNGFVIDFGKLKDLKAKFDEAFDHTLLLNRADPMRKEIEEFLTAMKIYNVRVVNDCSCEGVAHMIYLIADTTINHRTEGRVRVSRVTVYEDSKNSAAYEPDAPSQ
jgi:6-pyruvoyltetrahydropterin/6-carboxytetrahydropterin synthase